MSYRIEYKGVELLFDELPSAEALEAAYQELLAGKEKASRAIPRRLPTVSRTEPILASSTQTGFWFEAEVAGGIGTNQLPGVLRLRGHVDADVLERSFQKIIERHEILRTGFVNEGGTIYQHIHDNVEFRVQRRSLQVGSEEELVQRLRDIVGAETAKPFDLSQPPLIRLHLLELGPEDHVLVSLMHHSVADDWSSHPLLREFVELYRASLEGREPKLPMLDLQVADYTTWAREYTEGPLGEEQLDYWADQLRGARSLELPKRVARIEHLPQTNAIIRTPLSPELSAELEAWAKRNDVTIYQMLLSALAVLLGRYSGHTDVSIATPVHGRFHPQIENLIGCFLNMVVMRVQLDGEPTFLDLVQKVRELSNEGLQNQHVPFERVVDRVSPSRRRVGNPLYQVIYTVEFRPDYNLELPNLTIAPMSNVVMERVPAELAVRVGRDGDQIVPTFSYSSELFDERTIVRMAKYFEELIEQVVSSPGIAVTDIRLMSEEEASEVEAWTVGPTLEPSDSVVELFGRSVETQGSAPALLMSNLEWTYEELDRHANGIAQTLLERGTGPDSRVGISMERGPRLVAAIIGVLKAGAAFVPLEPTLPTSRLHFIHEKTGLRTVLCDSAGAQACAGLAAELIEADAVADSESSPSVDIDPDSLAYVMFTSGSTGEPKGVMITHRGLASVASTYNAILRPASADAERRVCLFKASYTFDIFVAELFPALCSGDAVAIHPGGRSIDPAALERTIRKHRVTEVWATPTNLQLLADIDWTDGPLKVVCSGGEPLTAPIVERVAGWGVELHNFYGPTEMCVGQTQMRVDPHNTSGVVPIGRAIHNNRVAPLDRRGQKTAPGFDGDIMIAGPGCARGYQDMPRRTALSFVPSLLGGAVGERMYRTGDVGGWTLDGAIGFRGRSDDQLQVRGIRVELGEIESRLASAPGVAHGVVVGTDVLAGRADSLVAFVVPEDATQPPLAGELRTHLESFLDVALVPSKFVFLDVLPMLPSGKVDRSALDPGIEQGGATPSELVEPRTEVEAEVAAVWRKHLELDTLGVHQEFFEIGGHSLRAVQIQAELVQMFEVELPLEDLIVRTTVADLAEYIAEKQTSLLEIDELEALLGDLEEE